jgi:hypothetical protein
VIPLVDQTLLGALRAAHCAPVLARACVGVLGCRDREHAALVFPGHFPRQYVDHSVSPSPYFVVALVVTDRK